MAVLADTYAVCPKCKGLGVSQTQRGEEDPCQMCDGVGGVKNGSVDIALIMKGLKRIFDKIDNG